MRRKSIAALVLTLIAALALVAAGCGGGSKNTAATTTTEAATTEAATTEATTNETATTEAATTEATTTEAATTEATTTTGLSGLASTGNCRELTNLAKKYQTAFSGAGQGADLKKAAAAMQEFAKKAPGDIKADFQVVADYFSKIAEATGSLKPGKTPDAATAAKLQKLATEIDQTKLTQASQNITAWVQKNCKA
jgi:hypothetical protein